MSGKMGAQYSGKVALGKVDGVQHRTREPSSTSPVSAGSHGLV